MNRSSNTALTFLRSLVLATRSAASFSLRLRFLRSDSGTEAIGLASSFFGVGLVSTFLAGDLVSTFLAGDFFSAGLAAAAFGAYAWTIISK